MCFQVEIRQSDSISIIDDLCDDSVWDDFLKRKSVNSKNSKKTEMEEFIKNRRYRETVESIREGNYEFKPVRRLEIPKPGTEDKRIVYTCKRDDITEHMVLRVFAELLQRYDDIFCDNLYSFRNTGGVQRAIARLQGIQKDIGLKYAYKADITKYFNSINRKKMERILIENRIDERSCDLIGKILDSSMVEFNGELIEDEERGILPGMPFSTFLSNLYLNDMDQHFHNNKVQYYRFADDILVLADSENELLEHVKYIRDFVKERGLEINPSKETFYKPHARIEFLGLYIQDGIFDINRKSLDKSIRRIRILGRYYRKTVEKHTKTVDEAVHCFLVKINQRFFGWKRKSKNSWSSWYFPLINTDDSLKKIDHQVQEWIRYIITGKHIEGNRCRISYKKLKKYQYVTLVNRFYNRNYKNRDRIGMMQD